MHPQANERITLPFKIQSFEPPAGYINSKHSVLQAPDSGVSKSKAVQRQEDDKPKGQVVCVEMVSVSHEHPIMVLELQIVPKPLVIDRTFR